MNLADFFHEVQTSIHETDLITWIATVSAVIYVFLALKENAWCWSFGILGSGLSVGVYISEHLYYEALLNVFYVALGIYGWIQWVKPATDKEELRVSKIPGRELLIVSGIAVLAGGILGYLSVWMGENKIIPVNNYAYTDAMLTTFSIVATWMTAKKYIENWIFWIMIDAGSAVLYIGKGPSLYLFALLFIFYTFMAAAGYFAWKKNLKA